jgi:hypothetical protein
MGDKSKSTLDDVFEARFRTAVCTTGNTEIRQLRPTRGQLIFLLVEDPVDSAFGVVLSEVGGELLILVGDIGD